MSSLDQTDKGEDFLDVALRPKLWKDYVGQKDVKKNLEIIIKAAKQRKEFPEHILFYGSSGLGKTTLAYLVAQEIGTNLHTTSGPAIERAGDLAAILTNLEDGDILFCDEIHRLPRVVEEYLYPAMEDFKLNLILGKGPMARTSELDLPHFTLIGATTRLALISSPLRARFGAIFGLNFYNKEEIKQIIKNSAKVLEIKIIDNALEIIADSSRFTPRTANHLLKRVRDFAQVEGEGIITEEIARKALSSLQIDHLGLNSNDRKILETIIEKFNGGPVGLQALAAATGEEMDAILDIYEPYLLQLGFIQRTPRGRISTDLAHKHLKKSPKNKQGKLI